MSCLVKVFTRGTLCSTPTGPQPKRAPGAARATTSSRRACDQKPPDVFGGGAASPRKSDNLDVDLDDGRSWASTKASSSWPISASGPGCNSPCSVSTEESRATCAAGEAEPRGWALGDFSIVTTVGSGFMGSVRLVKRASGGDPTPFALKVMKKSVVLRKKQVVHTRQEKELLSQVDHPFIVKLVGTFQDEANLYMLMEFVNGGELLSLLRSVERFQNDDAMFYAAEIILALGHIHSKSIAYRDLKPENVLLDSCGHAKLVDFGFAKVVRTRTYTMCGTPDYMAPEIINREGHDQCVDWWALGVLIHEMLSGGTPFQSANAQATYQKALLTQPKFPSSFTVNARGVITGLLAKSRRCRLGAGSSGGAEDVKGHPWLAAVDWDMLLQKQYRAPFLPTLTCSSDASMFGGYPDAAIDTSPSGLSEPEQRHFEGF